MSEEDRRLKVAVEAVGTATLMDAEVLRLTVEGEALTISLLAELIVNVVGGEVVKATVYGEDGELDITPTFNSAPAQIDPLDAGDPAE